MHCLTYDRTTDVDPAVQEIVERCAGARFYWGVPDVSFAIGPAPRLLGELALLTDDAAAARRHLEESVALCRSIRPGRSSSSRWPRSIAARVHRRRADSRQGTAGGG